MTIRGSVTFFGCSWRSVLGQRTRLGVIVKPVLQALLLADHVYEDKSTGKKIICGVFNRVFFSRAKKITREVVDGEIKARVKGGEESGSPFAFVSLTEVRGSVEFSVRYVELADDQTLLHTTFRVESDDPLVTVELILPLPKLPVRKPGTHALELLCDDELLGSLRVQVEELTDGDVK